MHTLVLVHVHTPVRVLRNVLVASSLLLAALCSQQQQQQQ